MTFEILDLPIEEGGNVNETVTEQAQQLVKAEQPKAETEGDLIPALEAAGVSLESALEYARAHSWVNARQGLNDIPGAKKSRIIAETSRFAQVVSDWAERQPKLAINLRGINETRVTISPTAESVKIAVLAEASEILSVKDEYNVEEATQCLRRMKQLTKEVEDARKAVKAPVLDLGRTIDALAKDFLKEVEGESDRVNKLLNAYATEQRRIQMEAERKRQEEERRQREAAERAERERIAAEIAAAKAERDRLAALDKEEEDKALEESRKAAQQAAEAAKKAEEARQAEEESKRQVAPTFEKPKGAAVRTVKKFTVTDIRALYAARPDLVRMEANASAINAALSGGMTECPGLEITEETVMNVRR